MVSGGQLIGQLGLNVPKSERERRIPGGALGAVLKVALASRSRPGSAITERALDSYSRVRHTGGRSQAEFLLVTTTRAEIKSSCRSVAIWRRQCRWIQGGALQHF